MARGQLKTDQRLYLGLEPSGNGSDQVAGEPDYTSEIPLTVTEELMRRGRQRFNIYCATCHGRAGDGDGAVSVRALALEQGTWVPPTSLHADHVRKQPPGKLFNTISNGIRKMPGYGDLLTPEDRWSIVLYLQALQRTRTATADDLPAGEIESLRELN